MPVAFRLARVAIIRSRRHFVLLAANREAAVPRVHAALQHFGPYYSVTEAMRGAEQAFADGRLFVGQTVANGHHSGASAPCGFGCDDEARFVAWLGDNVTRATPGADGRTEAARQVPQVPAVGLSLPAAPPSGAISANIASVGVELECEYPEGSAQAIVDLARRCPRMTRQYDASVHATQARHLTGEFTFWSTSMDELKQWLQEMFEVIGARTNASCGFHIHVRPRDGMQWAFATRGYVEGFHAAFRALASQRGGKYQDRVDGSPSRWCEMGRWTLEGVRELASPAGVRNRYQAVNLSSLSRHSFGTIEHRVMPYQNDKEEAIASVRWLVDTAERLFSAALPYADWEPGAREVDSAPGLRQRCEIQAASTLRWEYGARDARAVASQSVDVHASPTGGSFVEVAAPDLDLPAEFVGVR